MNKLYWITGGTSGIGLAVAETLAKKGASLILSSRTAENKKEIVSHLEKFGAKNVELANMNMTSPLSKNEIQKILNQKKLNGVVINSGGPKSGDLNSLSAEDFKNANELLLVGPQQFIQNCVSFLVPYKSSIVAITSTSVKEPVRNLNLSAIYRTGFSVYLKLLSKELSADGIRVNSVGPGPTKTKHLMNIIENESKIKNVPAHKIEKEWNQRSVLGRMGEPEEVAQAVSFLLSEEASFINGQILLADGNSTHCYF